MAEGTDQIKVKIEKLLKMLSKAGIHIERAFLFGSYAKKKQSEWSDIDLAIVSKDFCGVVFFDRKKINSYILKVDSSIEPHPFRPEDFTEENLFVKEILKNGIEIYSV